MIRIIARYVAAFTILAAVPLVVTPSSAGGATSVGLQVISKDVCTNDTCDVPNPMAKCCGTKGEWIKSVSCSKGNCADGGCPTAIDGDAP